MEYQLEYSLVIGRDKAGAGQLNGAKSGPPPGKRLHIKHALLSMAGLVYVRALHLLLGVFPYPGTQANLLPGGVGCSVH